jgi:hypothetical protein
MTEARYHMNFLCTLGEIKVYYKRNAVPLNNYKLVLFFHMEVIGKDNTWNGFSYVFEVRFQENSNLNFWISEISELDHSFQPLNGRDSREIGRIKQVYLILIFNLLPPFSLSWDGR